MKYSRFRRAIQANAAVEFSLLAPLLLLFVLGLVGFAVVLSTASGLQQLAAEAARASVGGLTDAERTQIAQAFVASHVASYPFLDPKQLTVATSALSAPMTAFQVSVDYDLSRGIVGQLATLMPALPAHLQRSAVITISTGL